MYHQHGRIIITIQLPKCSNKQFAGYPVLSTHQYWPPRIWGRAAARGRRRTCSAECQQTSGQPAGPGPGIWGCPPWAGWRWPDVNVVTMLWHYLMLPASPGGGGGRSHTPRGYRAEWGCAGRPCSPPPGPWSGERILFILYPNNSGEVS